MDFYRLEIWLCLLLVVTNSLYSQVRHDFSGFKRIDCALKPILRASRQDRTRSKHEHSTRPHMRIKRGTSTNWSGYAAVTNSNKPAKGSVSYVAGSWIVPKLSSSPHHTYCSIWVGIDGYGSNSVEQLGTEHDWVNGHQENYAWFEMYPDYSYEISGFPLSPGDLISASVNYIGNNVFVLAIRNNTKKVYSVIPKSRTTSATAQRASAEWVVEAPFLNKVLPLSHFNPVKFFNCSATIKGIHGPIKNRAWVSDALKMAAQNGVVKAIPSTLINQGKGFSVTWKHQ